MIVTITPPASPATPRVVRGRCLPLLKLGKAQRALLGAEAKEGFLTLTDMSVRQLASVFGVSPGYIAAALKASPLHREAVRRGLRSLVEPHPKTGAQERLGKIVEEIGVDGVLSLLAVNEQAAA